MKMAFAVTLAVMAGIFLSVWIAWSGMIYFADLRIEKIEQKIEQGKKIQDAKDEIENLKAKKLRDASDALYEEDQKLYDEIYEFSELNGDGSWFLPGSPGGPGTKKRAQMESIWNRP